MINMLKKVFIVGILILLLAGNVLAGSNYPNRYAKSVGDVSNPYVTDEWIIKPTEEEQDEFIGPPECDIREVIAAYDQDSLRVDIILHNSIDFRNDSFYIMNFGYENMDEYYIYFPARHECIYGVKVKDKIVKTKLLDLKNSGDRMGVSSANLKNNNVYFILNKYNHINGEKGKRVFVTASFLSGYVDQSGKMIFLDETMKVNMFFKI